MYHQRQSCVDCKFVCKLQPVVVVLMMIRGRPTTAAIDGNQKGLIFKKIKMLPPKARYDVDWESDWRSVQPASLAEQHFLHPFASKSTPNQSHLRTCTRLYVGQLIMIIYLALQCPTFAFPPFGWEMSFALRRWWRCRWSCALRSENPIKPLPKS